MWNFRMLDRLAKLCYFRQILKWKDLRRTGLRFLRKDLILKAQVIEKLLKKFGYIRTTSKEKSSLLRCGKSIKKSRVREIKIEAALPPLGIQQSQIL